MLKNMVSIIIPVYKTESYLAKCIESCMHQTYQNIEIILIEDGSPDRYGEICDAYAKQDERIRVIHKENTGVSDSRNEGLEIASGEFIMFVDSDDWIDAEMVEELVTAQQKYDVDLVECGHRNIYKDGKISLIIPDYKLFENKDMILT